MANISITILGCATSSGVPTIHTGWGSIDSHNPKNTRLRSAIAIETDDCHILVDFGPDLRQQLINYGRIDFDAIFCTHEHADHIHGLDELRWVCMKNCRDLPLYTKKRTIEALRDRFIYALTPLPEGVNFYFKPVLIPHEVTDTIKIKNSTFTVIDQKHGKIDSMGFRIDDFAYCTDVVDFAPEQFAKLRGIKVWVVDALRHNPHPTHAHVEKVLEWVDILKPEKTYLTHMDHSMDYEQLMHRLTKWG